MGVIKWDTRSLDYISHAFASIVLNAVLLNR